MIAGAFAAAPETRRSGATARRPPRTGSAQSRNAPFGDARQEFIVSGAESEQQLECTWPTPPVVPCFAAHFALVVSLQEVLPFLVVQHVILSVLPHVECEAHLITAPLHCFES
jgi:hypothetical protein